MTDDDAILKDIYIDASPQDVFGYLTDAERFVRWLGIAANIDPRPGGLFRVDPNGRDVIRGTFVEVVPYSRIVFTWGWEDASHPVPAGSTTVEITLKPEGNGTRLTLVHRGLSGESRDKHRWGWDHYLVRLQGAARGKDPGPDPLARPDIRHG